ncbi:hypothetical protein AAHA92_06411 [Salvia divinorum]|uniref:Uncharacterized protein n=1 Tax=Salvia divinorum TaxID=28513 RepID=A0ABD1I7U8_SALDI
MIKLKDRQSTSGGGQHSATAHTEMRSKKIHDHVDKPKERVQDDANKMQDDANKDAQLDKPTAETRSKRNHDHVEKPKERVQDDANKVQDDAIKNVQLDKADDSSLRPCHRSDSTSPRHDPPLLRNISSFPSKRAQNQSRTPPYAGAPSPAETVTPGAFPELEH